MCVRTVAIYVYGYEEVFRVYGIHVCFKIGFRNRRNDDGSIDVDSLDVTQSEIKINYRLSNDDVDDMHMEGVGYKEEWQLGALMSAASKRRAYRIRNGSTEGMIPQPIPKSFVSTFDDDSETDGIGIKVSVDPSHNQGLNV